MQKIIFLFPYLFIICFSCISDADIVLPEQKPEIVLNGTIHPKNIIQVSLTRSMPLNTEEQAFPIIEDANVIIFEDDKFLGKLSFEDSIYFIDYYPKEGHQYTVEVSIADSDHETVRASDIVPYNVTANACFLKHEYAFSDISVRAAITDRPSEVNFYWLDVTTINYQPFDCEFVAGDTSTRYCLGLDSSTVIREQEFLLNSYSTIPDNFNAFVDNTTDGITQYDAYIRIEDYVTNNQNITLDFTGSSQLFRYNVLYQATNEQSLVLTITSASQHYDRYLKSSILYYINNESFDEPNPFAEPIRIYSNVENGMGIFAAYNSVNIAVEDFPCQ